MITIRTGNRRYSFAKCEPLLGNCESLWQSDSPNFLSNTSHFLADCESLFKWIRQKTFFGSHLFFRQNFPFFRQILCIRCKNANKLRIMIRNCKSFCQCRATTKKWRITFRFLNPALVTIYYHKLSDKCKHA